MTPLKKADVLFSKFVRLRDGKCLRCGRQDGLQCHHLLTRTYRKVRFDSRNGVSVCFGCHKYLTHRPLENHEFAIELRGEEVWDDICATARRVDYKVDLKEVIAWLTNELKEMEAA